MSNVSYFSANEAISMLPLAKSYCKSLFYALKREEKRAKVLEMISNLTSSNRNKKAKIDRLMTKINSLAMSDMFKVAEWVKEIHKLGWECCKSLGRIDIPIWDADINRVIYLCFYKNSNQDTISWHEANEDAAHVRPYFYKNMEKKPNKVRKMPQ